MTGHLLNVLAALFVCCNTNPNDDIHPSHIDYLGRQSRRFWRMVLSFRDAEWMVALFEIVS
ncbi:MAG: hypothetical protein M0R50_05990 [Candidatus Cloacimonetes bacterium]|nr:hypothetical protein [Candidatus Cloacimonadota bacterium]